MKLYVVILKGFLIVWTPLTLTLIALFAAVLELRTAVAVGGIAGTIIAGIVTYLVVQGRAKAVERQLRSTHPGPRDG